MRSSCACAEPRSSVAWRTKREELLGHARVGDDPVSGMVLASVPAYPSPTGTGAFRMRRTLRMSRAA